MPLDSNLKSSDYVDSGVRVIRRENMGVLGNLGSILMALQAELPLLGFSVIAEEQKSAYFAAA